MVRAVRRVCPPALSDEAEDIVQLSMIKVMRVLDKDPDRDLRPSYLKRVAYSVVVDELRRRRLDRYATLEDADVFGDDGPGPLRVTAARTTLESVRECLAGLVENRRLAVTCWLLGHSARETGEMMGWTTKKAEVLTYRGVAQLRACLTAKGIEP